MTRRSRRTLLCSAAGLVALSAGCLDEAGLSDDESDANGGDTDDPGSGDNGDETDGENDTTPELEGYDAQRLEHADAPTDPEARLYVDADPVLDWLADRDLDESPHTEFVDETPFEESVLLVLEADAPRLDYALELESVALETGDGENETATETGDGDGNENTNETADETANESTDPRLVVDAAVEETSDSEEFGGTQVVAVGQLVRATFAGDPVTDASVTIVDSDGQSHELTVAAGDGDDGGDEGNDADDGEADES